jgi:predicted dehydrogenase
VAEWTILGSSPTAEALRHAALFIDAPEERIVVADGTDVPTGAITTGAAALHPNADRVVSELLGFRVFEDALSLTRGGELGALYSVFGSFRLTRGASDEVVRHEALLPLLCYGLALLPQPVTRVWATAASVETQDDCWFVTLRFEDDVIVSLEALAVADPAASSEALVEIIGAERVLRCEPTRQSVSVERVGQATHLAPWWEDGAERLLQLLASPEPPLVDGARLRAVWDAALQSAQDGQPRTTG